MEQVNSALLVMDMQAAIVATLSEGASTLLANTATAIAAARQRGIPVIFVVVGFRNGAPDLPDAGGGDIRGGVVGHRGIRDGSDVVYQAVVVWRGAYYLGVGERFRGNLYPPK